MAASTGRSLQRGICQALANSSRLGGTRIYDDPPRAASYPFITLGQSLLRDWSTGTEDRAEHLLTLHVWSRACGKKQVHDILEAIKSILHNQPLSLVDLEFVNLRHEFSEARPDPDGDTYHGMVRYRAVTEPAQAEAA